LSCEVQEQARADADVQQTPPTGELSERGDVPHEGPHHGVITSEVPPIGVEHLAGLVEKLPAEGLALTHDGIGRRGEWVDEDETTGATHDPVVRGEMQEPHRCRSAYQAVARRGRAPTVAGGGGLGFDRHVLWARAGDGTRMRAAIPTR